MAIDFVLGKAEGPNLKNLSQKVNVVDLGSKKVYGWLGPMITHLKSSEPNIIFSGLHHANLIAIWAKMVSGAKSKLIVSVHGQLSQDVGYSKKKLAKVIPLLVRLFYPKADKVVCVSHGVAQELITRYHLPEKNIDVIYNPVITKDIFEKADEPIDHPWFKSGQTPVILGIGRLHPQKDFPNLIRAFDMVRRIRPSRLIILGEGPEREDLAALIKELNLENDVALPGFVDNPYKYMKSSSVFVLSSRWEGLPTVFIEALALGVPVVSTDCPSGPAEILEDGKWGRLVPVGNHEALATAILEAMDKPRGLGIGRAMDFTLEKIASQYQELIRTLKVKDG